MCRGCCTAPRLASVSSVFPDLELLYKSFSSVLKNFIFVGYKFLELGSRYVTWLLSRKRVECIKRHQRQKSSKGGRTFTNNSGISIFLAILIQPVEKDRKVMIWQLVSVDQKIECGCHWRKTFCKNSGCAHIFRSFKIYLNVF